MTVNVYAVPFVNPVTVHVAALPAAVHVAPPGLAVTVYPVRPPVPSETGAVHDTATWPLPGSPNTSVGAPGNAYGVTADEALLALELPYALVAITVNVYAVPFVNPVTVHVVAPLDQVHVAPPGLAVTVYPVTPPVPPDAGAVHETTTCVLPATPETPVGAPANAYGVTELDALLALELAYALAATTVNVYAVPFVNPGTVHVVALDEVHVAPPGLAVTV